LPSAASSPADRTLESGTSPIDFAANYVAARRLRSFRRPVPRARGWRRRGQRPTIHASEKRAKGVIVNTFKSTTALLAAVAATAVVTGGALWARTTR
jgi:hypothetical protein